MGDAKTSDRIKDVGRLEKPRHAGGYSYHQSKNLVSWGRPVRAVPIFPKRPPSALVRELFSRQQTAV